ncbi:WhiB family redox-sensing transcriptional regulator [Kitasatospora gansuensis]|uniref:Transcriptional regulator WhiB n=1 Tax=Kitasatospora gansuensis TaxID=258050 RepID=A0A7W7WGY2_9ACTN|nr:WhiB family transcriptional regulator [Kitasatospora gansuensis]MBB4947187.1 WhiB family redox-sensing transcriptional regulator [Kitasatospora gansuensis]
MLHPIESSARVATQPAARSTTAPAAVAAQRLEHQEDSPWHTGAACRRDEAGLFFAPSKEPTAARLSREEHAKQVCARCPVLLECREHALAQPEPYGVWGGLTAAERRVVLARRRRREAELRIPAARRIAG